MRSVRTSFRASISPDILLCCVYFDVEEFALRRESSLASVLILHILRFFRMLVLFTDTACEIFFSSFIAARSMHK